MTHVSSTQEWIEILARFLNIFGLLFIQTKLIFQKSKTIIEVLFLNVDIFLSGFFQERRPEQMLALALFAANG